jgi:formate hydrogenlyase subunit 3/multisubunit Na+/H+ antiporter MnhD subunit
VKAVLVLNLLDAVLTLFWVRSGLASEANTLIDELVSDQAVVFVCVKLALVGMGSWLLLKHRESPLAVMAIFAAFMTYYLVLLYHLQYASGLIRQLVS